MKNFVAFLLVIFYPFFLLAQKETSTSPDVKALFTRPNEIKWIKHFAGRIDDVTDISVTLAYDGTNCKGWVTYLESGEQFKLEGFLNGYALRLEEIDAKEEVSGYIKGIFENKTINAEWSNYNNNIGSRIFLNEVIQPLRIPTNCGDNKWLHTYRGIAGVEEVELILQKGNNRALRGVWYFKKQQKTCYIRGSIEQGNLQFALKDQRGAEVGIFRGKYLNAKEVSASLKLKDSLNQEIRVNLELKNIYSVGCLEYADYVSSYDIIYPKLPGNYFNNWVGNLATNWMEACMLKSKNLKEQNKDLLRYVRAASRAYAWCDLEYYDNNIVSGFISFENTWTDGRDGESFCFDLLNEKPIVLEDIFEKGSNYNSIILNYIKRETPNNIFSTDKDFMAWIEKEGFPFFTIHSEGINFSTKQNFIYGRQNVTIPFSELRNYIKKDSPIRSIFDEDANQSFSVDNVKNKIKQTLSKIYPKKKEVD